MRGFCSVHSSGVVHQDWSAFRGRAGLLFQQRFLTTGRGFGFGLFSSGISRGANPRQAIDFHAPDNAFNNGVDALPSHSPEPFAVPVSDEDTKPRKASQGAAQISQGLGNAG